MGVINSLKPGVQVTKELYKLSFYYAIDYYIYYAWPRVSFLHHYLVSFSLYYVTSLL